MDPEFVLGSNDYLIDEEPTMVCSSTVRSPAVELRDVTKTFSGRRRRDEDVVAVRNVDLAIAPGEFFTLLGPSGCGKTTTLRPIAGFERPSSGWLSISGKEMSAVPAHQRPVQVLSPREKT